MCSCECSCTLWPVHAAETALGSLLLSFVWDEGKPAQTVVSEP